MPASSRHPPLAALAAAALVLASTGTEAARFIGHFDPEFGPGVPGLGFRGHVLFEVPDACLAQSGVVPNGDACANFGMAALNATVEFYNVNDAGLPTLNTQLFPDVALTQVRLGAGGLLTADSLLAAVAGLMVQNQDSSALFSGDMWLAFRELAFQPYAILYTCDPSTTGCDASTVSNRALVQLSAVPEPGSMALVAAALVAGVAANRRRTAARRG